MDDVLGVVLGGEESNSGSRWPGQQLFQFIIIELRIHRIGTPPCRMAPDRLNGTEGRVGHQTGLILAILRREVQIRAARHNICARFDIPQSLFKIPVVQRVRADISVLPRPEHGQQIIRVLLEKIVLPLVDQEIFQLLIAGCLVQLLAIERLRECPASVDTTHSLQTDGRR